MNSLLIRLGCVSWRLAVAPLCLLLFGAFASADIVVQTSPAPQRGVSAQASIGGSSDSQSISFDQGGTFNNNASALVFSDDGLAFASAAQDTTIPDLTGSSMSGKGSASGGALPNSPNTGSYSASSFFDVFFQVDTTDTFRLTGFVTYLEPGAPNSGSASLILTDVDNSNTLFSISHSDSDPGVTNFDQSFLLTAGVTYHLLVQASTGAEIVDSDVFSFGGGAWQFRLASSTAVPEPSAIVLVLCGLIVTPMAVGSRYRSKS